MARSISVIQATIAVLLLTYFPSIAHSAEQTVTFQQGQTGPSAATLISPAGKTANTPDYRWEAVSGMTWYYLWVDDSTGNIIKKWYTAAQAGCESGTGLCSVTPVTTLADGIGRWWVKTWNASENGAWSKAKTFNVTDDGPGTAVLLEPAGLLSDNTPSYSWYAVPESSWYYLWVDDSTGNVIKKWYTAAQVGCEAGTGLCSVTPITTLANGNGKWWIRTWNSSGDGLWSGASTFTLGTSTGNIASKEAARFLAQTTFGPTLEGIDHLVSLGSYEAWLTEQFNEPASLQLQATKSIIRRQCSNPDVIDGDFQEARIDAWWNTVINGNDQLRQRVAFALSEIFVVSGVSLAGSQYGLADYTDMLAENSFGNFRELLEDVTLHPVMGLYLSMLYNRKAQADLNIRPDENYAREVMQLFSIGVHQLNLDGTLKQHNGKPIPTFDQNDVEAFSRVFTGWKFANVNWGAYIGNGDRTVPMVPFEEFHDRSEKHLLNGQVLAAGQTAQQDLDAAMDNLFNHPNVAPFIGKQLIQRLVTSNPSTTYVERVATVFNDNGQGQRGDLKAVIKAILLDTEARSGHLNSTTFGKLREPLLRLSHIRRAFPVIPVVREGERWGSGTCGEDPYELYLMALPFPWDFRLVFGQDMLRAPSVFNFFRPDFSPPGPIRNQGLVAPEFQIMTENTLTGSYRSINYEIQNSGESRNLAVLNTAWAEALADDTEALLDQLDLVLLSESMPTEMRAILTDHLNNANFHADAQQRRAAKVRETISLIVASPNYLIQQ